MASSSCLTCSTPGLSFGRFHFRKSFDLLALGLAGCENWKNKGQRMFIELTRAIAGNPKAFVAARHIVRMHRVKREGREYTKLHLTGGSPETLDVLEEPQLIKDFAVRLASQGQA